MNSTLKEIEKVVIPALEGEDVELVDMQLKGRPGSQSLKIFIDCAQGVSLQRCTEVSRVLSAALDIADIMPGRYRLEVSSPGVGRPLVTARDFQRNLNREVELILEDDAGDKTLRGTIIEVSEHDIGIQSKKESLRIPLSRIRQGQLSLPW